ncbi:right-handed parallel beta-helix repeat-containing protein [Legionella clemsonensis]|uniref:Uncharacterized protein n=1 Tax=Legionella clemsonensis TaxID=1867846 RepID=A0A222NZP1_9GAMM|nr:hypothetical protein [Legionella clemsonensis]ASQ45041.1 hypothetical protein clem_02395 [Legionella clemsonensis]
MINLVEETGNGVDGVIGLTPPDTSYLRLFAGGYHFSFKEAQDINGIIGGVEMPLNQYFTVSVRDSYDRVQKNTALLTLRLTLGGIAKSEQPNIHERLLDPIPRHLGTWNTGAGIPTQQAYVNTGVQVLTRDNIWFFSSSGAPFVAANGLSNCTFENKCNSTSFNQLTLDAIDSFSPNANFYLGPATYGTLNSVSSMRSHTTALLSTLSLNEGQSIYGRNGDYKARQNETIIGSLILSGNDTIDSVTLLNNNGENLAGLIIRGSNIRITNSKIGQYSNLTGYRSAIEIEGANNVTIESSDVIAFLEDRDIFDGAPIGILVQSSTDIHLLNNNILVEATQNISDFATAQGIVIFQSKDVEIQNKRLDVKTFSSGGEVAFATGIQLVESQATILKSLLYPERLPEEMIRHPNIDPLVPAAFNVEAHTVGGENNFSTAIGIEVRRSTALINYNLNISPSIGEARDKIQVTAENIGGNSNIVGAFGMIIFEGRASVKGVHLNVDAIDMNGNGSVFASGYEVGGFTSPSILALSPSVNTIRATTNNSTATLDAMGINVYEGGEIAPGYDINQFFIVTENGQRVFPPIRIIS